MVGKIKLVLDKNSIDYEISKKYEITEGIKNTYEIKILTDTNESFDKLITNYNLIRENFKEAYQDLFMDIEEIQQARKFLKQHIDKNNDYYKELFDNCEFILIDGSYVEMLEYLKNNACLKNKKIIINENLDLNDENINYIETIFKEFDNIYVGTDGNDNPVKLSDFIKTKSIINKLVKKVKKFNFSPMEQIMYVYDLVRDRVYTKEAKDEDYAISRDLTNILLGDKIVCVGYAHLFDILLKKLGFKTMLYKIYNPNTKIGHVRNIVYIIDDKYEINGVYFFDTTWDSKTSDNIHLYSYRFFAKTKNEIEEYQSNEYLDATLPEINEDFFFDFITKLNNIGLDINDGNKIDDINKISRIIDNKTLIDKNIFSPYYNSLPKQMRQDFNKNNIVRDLERYDELLNSPISANTLLKMLYEVRKNEYYEDPINYPFNVDNLFSIVVNSNWIFDDENSKIFGVIFGKDYGKKCRELIQRNMIKYIEDNDLELKIEQIKLTKTLRNIYEKKKKDK